MAKLKKLTDEEKEKMMKFTIEQMIWWISENLGNDVETIKALIKATDGKGCRFASIKGYSSDKSNGTELADFVINIGVNYMNQVEKSVKAYGEIAPAELSEKEFDYSSINLNGVELKAFQKEVKQNFPLALVELQNPDTGSRKNYNYKFNNALMFNLSTLNWLIAGTKVSKSVEVVGEYHKAVSAPLTVAKTIIKAYAGVPTSNIRTFKVGNVLATVSANGDTVIVAGGQVDEK